MKLFSDSMPFYKANFHCHTTCSDGQLTPAECMEFYRDAGYQVLSVTDHRRVTDPGPAPAGLLMLPGIELDFMLPEQCVHIIGVGVQKEIETGWDPAGTPQLAVDAVRRFGGRAILAHPAWSLNTPALIGSLKGLCGTEIWNSVSTIPHNADRSDSSSLLDVAWTSGPLLNVLAGDDSHWYDGEAGRSATMVQAESLTPEGILSALDAGRFYATLGPLVRQVTVENGSVTVEHSPADTVIFYSNRPWVNGRCRTGLGMTRSVYEICPGDRFVRCEIRDAEGRRAWTSPVAVN